MAKINNIFNKKSDRGWIRIVEAAFAIMLIVSVILTVYVRSTRTTNLEAQVYDIQKIVLSKVAENDTLRGYVLNNDAGGVISGISADIPGNLDFNISICRLDVDSCPLQNANVAGEKSIYVADRVIAVSGAIFSPKKLRLFLWERR